MIMRKCNDEPRKHGHTRKPVLDSQQFASKQPSCWFVQAFESPNRSHMGTDLVSIVALHLSSLANLDNFTALRCHSMRTSQLSLGPLTISGHTCIKTQAHWLRSLSECAWLWWSHPMRDDSSQHTCLLPLLSSPEDPIRPCPIALEASQRTPWSFLLSLFMHECWWQHAGRIIRASDTMAYNGRSEIGNHAPTMHKHMHAYWHMIMIGVSLSKTQLFCADKSAR